MSGSEGPGPAGSPAPVPGFDVWGTIARWRAAGRRFVLLTVVESRGFTPQKPGIHMLVAEDGEAAGTIGGGAIEHACVEEARALLPSGEAARMVRKQLTTGLGRGGGGEMVVHLGSSRPSPACSSSAPATWRARSRRSPPRRASP